MATGTVVLAVPCSLDTWQVTPSLRTSAVATRVTLLTTLVPSTDTDWKERGARAYYPTLITNRLLGQGANSDTRGPQGLLPVLQRASR